MSLTDRLYGQCMMGALLHALTALTFVALLIIFAVELVPFLTLRLSAINTRETSLIFRRQRNLS